MSDGPHKSLNMRSGWKKVAQSADQPAYDVGDVSNRVVSAFAQDWRADISDHLIRNVLTVLENRQNALFRDQTAVELEALRRKTSGHGLAQILLNCAIHHANIGRTGRDAAVKAAADALSIWAERHCRQVEEHYCRKSNSRRAYEVRARIETAIRKISLCTVVRGFLTLGPRPASHVLAKQTGLDDGVHL